MKYSIGKNSITPKEEATKDVNSSQRSDQIHSGSFSGSQDFPLFERDSQNTDLSMIDIGSYVSQPK